MIDRRWVIIFFLHPETLYMKTIKNITYMNKILFEKTLNSLKNIAIDYKELGDNIYLVGGCVRDLQLGLTPKDIDLCIDYPNGVNLFMEFIQNNYSNICSGFVTYPRYGTSKFSLLVCGENIDIECVIPRVETYNQGPRKPDSVLQTSIQEDATRRDFCCNALYMNLLSGELLDPTGHGIDDCKNKILRTPLNPQETFIDDPLRMLRAIRFSVCKGFEILPDVFQKITDYDVYYRLSMERVNDEFTKIILSDRPEYGIGLLYDTGLLNYISPELNTSFSFDQHSKYHHLTLGKHQMEVLKLVSEKRVSCGDIVLRLAAIFHDIGKLHNYQVKENEEYSYHGHEISSGVDAERILRRLKYPEKIISGVKFLIQNHMCIKQFYNYSKDEYTGSSKTTRKILRLLGDYYRQEMVLIGADNMAHHPIYCMPGQVKSFKRKAILVQEEKRASKTSFTVPISGNDIMTFLGISPGVLVKEIKEILQDYYDSDPELTKDALLKMFKDEFTGKDFYIVKDSEIGIRADISVIEYASSGKIKYNTTWITPKDMIGFNMVNNIVYKLPAIDHPKLYRQLIRNSEGLKILETIEKEIDKLTRKSEFSWLKINLENNDLNMTIGWDDDTLTGIL